METAIKNSGKPNTRMEWYYKLLPNTVIEKLVEYATEELLRYGHEATHSLEMRQNFALMLVHSRYNISSEILWNEDLKEAASRNQNFLPAHE